MCHSDPPSCDLVVHFDVSLQLDPLSWGVTKYNKARLKYAAKALPHPTSSPLFLFLHKRPIYGKVREPGDAPTAESLGNTAAVWGTAESVCRYINHAASSRNHLGR